MANVIFKQGTRAKYDALAVKDSNTLYWLSGTQELYKGEVLYGKGAEATALASGLLSAADKRKLDSLTAGGIAGLTAVDNSVVIAEGEDGTTIGVKISNEGGNAIQLKDDGLFVPEADAPVPVEFSIEEQTTPNAGFEKTYKMKRTEGETVTYVGDDINIPTNAVLSGGTFKVVETAGVPYEGAEVGDPYVDLIIADAESSHIYIPMKGLVNTVSAGDGVAISNNTMSIKLNESNSNGLSVDANGLGMAVATAATAGAMSAEDKAKLDSISTDVAEIKNSVVWSDM